MIDYGNILSVFYNNKNWRIENSIDFNTLTWLDKSPKPTKEELDSKWEEFLSITKKQNCKIKSQVLLNESDWSDLYSVRQKLENINEWDSYREIIRELRINPIENPIFPDKPQTIWKEIISTPIEETIVAQEEPIQEKIVNLIEEPTINNEEP